MPSKHQEPIAQPTNARRYARDVFSGGDRFWARTAVTMMCALGVAHKAQIQALREVVDVSRESGQGCESLYGDPVTWAQGIADATSTGCSTGGLYMPRRASWIGRLWYAHLAMVFWAFMAPMPLVFSSATGLELSGSVAVVAAAVLTYLVLWGTFIWFYEGPKRFSESNQLLIHLVVILGAIGAVMALKAFGPTETIWSGTIPLWFVFLAIIPGALGLWLLRNVRKRPFPDGPVSQRRWRSLFLGVMVSRKFYPAGVARRYLKELEADAAEMSRARGVDSDLNVLGPAHLVAGSFEAADLEGDPVLWREECRQNWIKSIYWTVVICGYVALPIPGAPSWLIVMDVMYLAAALGLTWMKWKTYRECLLPDDHGESGRSSSW